MGTIYGLATLPLSERIHQEVFLEEDVVLLMYADDIATIGAHRVNAKCLAKLHEYGPSFGYIPQPEICVYICAEQDEPAACAAFTAKNLVV